MPDQQHPQRRSPRLPGYDYAQSGAYFVTICTHNRAHLLGQIVDGEMMLNNYGVVAHSCWLDIPDHHPNVDIDLHIVMPNHVHGIIWIHDAVSRGGRDGSRPYRKITSPIDFL